MLWLYVQAPFATFRNFTAGGYRPSAEFLTPSAAYGLALNLAGIESRWDDGKSPMTLTKPDLPPARIVLGAVGGFPTKQSLYQQLHNYPVGASGKHRKDDAKGNKYNITPVRRELLVDLKVCLGLDSPAIEPLVRAGLEGKCPRYGLPFLGDNNFLPDRIDRLDGPILAYWYRRIGADADEGIMPRTTRLTIQIDRADMSRTQSALYAPDADPSLEPLGPDYWTAI